MKSNTHKCFGFLRLIFRIMKEEEEFVLPTDSQQPPPKLLKITETKIKLCKYRHYFNIHHNFQKGKSGHISILTDEAFCQQVKQQIKGFLREFLLQFNH